MDAREEKGREIAARMRIVKRDNAWLVPSQTGRGAYRVTLDQNNLRCTCPDFELRAKRCKHIYACAFVVQRETTVTETTTVDGTTTTTVTETAAVRVTYPQRWREYNQAQTREKELFCRLLRDLCLSVPEPVQERGRPRIPLADALFAATYKVYSGMSARRFMTDLREAHAAGYVEHPWHFNPVLRVIADAELTPTLYALVTASSAPLGAVESKFAVDSTGFGTVRFYRHFSHKYGREQESHDWLKLHAIVGCNTNVVAAASVTDRNANDSPQFEPLVLAASDEFQIRELMADKAYGSRKNVALAATVGATPYIALRTNAQGVNVRSPGRSLDSTVWRWLHDSYALQRESFLSHYHQRSNVESTFSAMKRVFGDTLRAKGFDAQVNETLLKVISYNIVCVVHSIFELGVTIPGLESVGLAG